MRAWKLSHSHLCLLLGVVLAAHTCYGQQLQTLLPLQDRVAGKGIEFGVDKITNTFVWTGNADIDLPTAVGQFRFVNQYRSSAFRTASVATRDDQQSQIAWETPLASTVSAVLRQGWLLSQDSRSVGLNSLQRINGALGLRYAPIREASIEALGGMESSTQLGVHATGPVAIVRGVLDDYLLDDWNLSSSAIADWQKLDARRTNTDVDVTARVSRELDEGTSLRLSAQTTLRGLLLHPRLWLLWLGIDPHHRWIRPRRNLNHSPIGGCRNSVQPPRRLKSPWNADQRG